MRTPFRASNGHFTAIIALLALGCGGNSVSHVDGGSMTGASESGGTSGTTGTTGGSSGKGGSVTGGTSASGGSSGAGGSSGSGGSGTAGDAGASGTAGRAGAGGASGSGGDAGSPCLAPACPENPPADGEACSSCGPPLDCQWDRQAVDGLTYFGQCFGDVWSVTSGDEQRTCCMNDAACGPSCDDGTCPQLVCVNGRCLSADPGMCWREDQCDSGEKCSSAFVCGCDAQCSTKDRQGTCVLSNDNCCLSDDDCPDQGECVAGVCKAPPSEGCWRDDDCPGSSGCIMANICRCGASCLVADSAGNCVIPL